MNATDTNAAKLLDDLLFWIGERGLVTPLYFLIATAGVVSAAFI